MTDWPFGLNRCHECGKRTSEAKPYCVAHIGLMPYVASIWEAADRDKRARHKRRDRLARLRKLEEDHANRELD